MTTKAPLALPPALSEFLSSAFIERLLAMQHRSNDRDYNEQWLAYDNFGEFYAANKQLFIVSFSKPEMMVSAVINTFTHRQLSTLFSRAPVKQGGGFERVNAAFTQIIADNYEQLRATLEKTWPAEYADILKKDAAGGVFF